MNHPQQGSAEHPSVLLKPRTLAQIRNPDGIQQEDMVAIGMYILGSRPKFEAHGGLELVNQGNKKDGGPLRHAFTTILSVGPLVTVDLRPGDRVVYVNGVSCDAELDFKDLIVLHQQNIFGRARRPGETDAELKAWQDDLVHRRSDREKEIATIVEMIVANLRKVPA